MKKGKRVRKFGVIFRFFIYKVIEEFKSSIGCELDNDFIFGLDNGSDFEFGNGYVFELENGLDFFKEVVGFYVDRLEVDIGIEYRILKIDVSLFTSNDKRRFLKFGKTDF